MSQGHNGRSKVALGLDFGTESVRAVLVTADGEQLGSAVSRYRHGQIVHALPSGAGLVLPERYALQHPEDWLESAHEAITGALLSARRKARHVMGIGVDFTSCTMLPVDAEGEPLCMQEGFQKRAQAWPKLWKHHGAIEQAQNINDAATEANVSWLSRYGGQVGLEWMWPKMLECFDVNREVFDATARFVEAGDWIVWKLTGQPLSALKRSTCQAGYKACWSREQGYPGADFLNALRPGFAELALERLSGEHRAPGERVGVLSTEFASRLGLAPGIPISAAIIDAHAAVPGVGAGEAGALVMVLGTSACHMLNARQNHNVPGVAGIVQDGIMPGFVGYEMGQAAVGDAFAWLSRLTNRKLALLANEASVLEPGAGGVMCLDWFNGCRTPLMDGHLKGALYGLTLSTTGGHLYRAIAEGTAFGLRWIVELLKRHEVPVERLIATGGLPHQVLFLIQLYADVLGLPIEIHPTLHASAVGAAILGAVAAGSEGGGFDDVPSAVQAMAEPIDRRVEPRLENTRAYHALYARYRALADEVSSDRNKALSS